MTNESIRAAFERFWLHIVNKLTGKADINHNHSWDDVGKKVEEVVVLEETTLTFAEANTADGKSCAFVKPNSFSDVTNKIKRGETYIVSFDNNEYECISWSDGNLGAPWGRPKGDWSDYPFEITFVFSGVWADPSYIGKTVNMSIKQVSETITTLPAEFLPVDAALSSTSTNPVQNKVITNKFNSLARRISEVAYNGPTNPIAYYEIGRMFTYNSGDNRGSILFIGRLGHWVSTGIANFIILLSNRGEVRASVFAQGSVENALAQCDIEVYRQDDGTDIVYMKTNGYWCFDMEYVAYQHTVAYKNVPVTPTGTLVWKLSETPMVSIDFEGNMTTNALTVNDVSFSSLVDRVERLENVMAGLTDANGVSF